MGGELGNHLRIVMLSVDYLPNIGGVAAHVFNLSRSLQEIGHKICVVNPVPGKDWNIDIVEDGGVPVCRVTYPFFRERVKRIVTRIKASIRGIHHAAFFLGGVDIVHQHDYIASSPAAKIVTFSRSLRRLGTSRIHWVWTNHTSQFVMDFERLLKRQLMRFMYKGVKGIIAVSREIESKSKVVFRSKDIHVTYIPNGVDVEKFSPNVKVDRTKYGLSEEDFVVLCPRRMVEKNGIIYLASAVHLIRQKWPDLNWKFVFLGDEPAVNTDVGYIRKVKNILEEPHRQGYVKYLGNVLMDQMPEINALANVVVIPSLIEAVSLSALEAMATGKPVIATNVGGLPEIVRDGVTGILIPPKDSVAIANALERIYFDHSARLRIGNNGFELVKRMYAWESIARMTEDFYQKLG